MTWTRVLSKTDERDFSLKISAALHCEGLAARHGERNNPPRPQGEAHPTYPSAACAHLQSTFQRGVSRTKLFFFYYWLYFELAVWICEAAAEGSHSAGGGWTMRRQRRRRRQRV